MRALVLPLLVSPALAQVDRDVDLAYVRAAAEATEVRLPEVEEAWRARLAGDGDRDASFEQLFGYDPPGTAVQAAWLRAFLFEVEGDPDDARAAADLLVRHAYYRDDVPAALRDARVEYAYGLPAITSFFQLPEFAEAWGRVRHADVLDATTRAVVDDALANGADFVFTFPEWGAHNRALLRALGLLLTARTLPDHPRADDWRAMAEVLAADSLRAWEIEDAQVYHPIWLLALYRYAAAAGIEDEVLDTVQARYYPRYLLGLLTPAGNVPPFGDGWWDGSQARLYACLEWAAAAYGDPELRWGARRVWEAMGPVDGAAPSAGRARLFALLHGRVDASLAARVPPVRSGPVVDDALGGKLVLRTGWGPDDLYLCLNYRDEGNWGWRQREYLRRTLAVEHEKAHHGNEDEGSIALFMDGGAVLLCDGGYREAVPSGPHGAFRADVFHDRVVVRAAGHPDLAEALLDEGTYEPVRSELLDHVELDLASYARVRVTGSAPAYTWDRVVVAPRSPRCVVVIDTVVTPQPAGTVASLWAAQEVRANEVGAARTAYTSLRGRALGEGELRLSFPLEDEPREVLPLRRHADDGAVLVAREVGRVGTRTTFVTVLQGDAEVQAHEDTHLALRLDDGDASLHLFVRLDLDHGLREPHLRPRDDPEASVLAGGPFATDADLALCRVEAGRLQWEFANAARLTLLGTPVFTARPFQVFQPSGRSDVVGTARWRRWSGVLPR